MTLPVISGPYPIAGGVRAEEVADGTQRLLAPAVGPHSGAGGWVDCGSW